MNRFSSAVLIGIVLCTSGNDRSFAAGNDDANANVASTASPEEAAIQPLPTKPDLRRAQPPMKAISLDEEEIFPRPGRSSVRRSSSIRNFLPRIGFAPMHV